MKVILLASLLALASGPSIILAQTAAAGRTVTPKAQQIHDSAIVVDTHADTPQRFLDGGFDIGSTDPADNGHISLDKARAGNLSAEFFSIWVDPRISANHFAQKTLDLIDSVYQQAARHPDRMMMAFSVDDIERAHKERKLAALMGIEGGHSIENDIHLLRDFYRLGVRYMTLSWSNTNEWADSSGDMNDTKIQHHNGLTFRQGSGFGDESAGHDDRHLPRRRQNILGCDGHQQGTGHCVTLLSSRDREPSPQHDRRYVARGGEERRRGADELLLRLR
jgi:membrane dipeptidase